MPRIVPLVVTGDGKEVEALFDRIEQRGERLKSKLRAPTTGLSPADLKALEQFSKEQARLAQGIEREQIRAAANVEKTRIAVAERTAAREAKAAQTAARETTKAQQQAAQAAVRAEEQKERRLNQLAEAELRRVQKSAREGLKAAEFAAAQQRRLVDQLAKDRARAANDAAQAEVRAYEYARKAAERSAKEQKQAAMERRDNFKAAGKGIAAGGAAYTAAVSVPLVAFGKEALERAASYEALEKGLAAVEGGAENARKKLVELREVAKLPGLGLREAIEGQTQLNAALQDSQLTTRSLAAFGNALATVGKGKADLDGVITALSQIATKSKISAEEINQLGERVPQIRRIIEAAYGTADTEKLQKAGIKPIDFIKKIVGELEKLPKVEGGIANTLENLSDLVDQSFVRIGKAIAPVVVPMLEKLADVIDFVSSAFERLPKGGQTTVVLLGILAAALGPVIIAAGAVVAAIGVIGIKLVILGAIIGAAVGVIAGLWVSNFGGIRDFTIKFATEVYRVIEHLLGIVVAAWNENMPLIRQIVESVLGEVSAFWDEWGGTITSVAKFIFDAVATYVEIGLRQALAVIRIVLQLINKDWSGAWETFIKTCYEVNRLLQPFGDKLADLLKTAVKTAIVGVLKLDTWIREQMVKLGVLIAESVLSGIATASSPERLAASILTAVTSYGGAAQTKLAAAGSEMAAATARGRKAGLSSGLNETFDLGGYLSGLFGTGGDLTGGVGEFVRKDSGGGKLDLSGAVKKKKAEFNADQLKIARRAYETAVQLGASQRELLALFSAGLVESGFRNLPGGDRDSLGFLQQRPSMGWGRPEQILNIEYATRAFLEGAGTNKGALDIPGLGPGTLAQAVQRSAFPKKYQARLPQAQRLLAEVVGDSTVSEADLKKIEEARRQRAFDKILGGMGYTITRDDAGKVATFAMPERAVDAGQGVLAGGPIMRETTDAAYRREIDERYFGKLEATGYKNAQGVEEYEKRGGAYEAFITRQRNLDKELEAVRRDAFLERKNRELDYIANAEKSESTLHELRLENADAETVANRRRMKVLDEELQLAQDITDLEDKLATQGANSASRYQKAWLQAIYDVREADFAAVESQIQSQVKLADATVLHGEQVRAKVLEHLAQQKSLTDSVADTMISSYDRVAGWLDRAIDKLTGRLSFLNDILKAIVRQILNAAFQRLLDALSGKGSTGTGGGQGGGKGGGFLSSLGNFFGSIFKSRGATGAGAAAASGGAQGAVSAFGSGASGLVTGGAFGVPTQAAQSSFLQGLAPELFSSVSAPTSFAAAQASQAAAAQATAAAAQGGVGAAAGASLATGAGASGFGAALAPLLPLLGAQFGMQLGGQSILGNILGGVGGLALGGAGAVALLGGAGAAIFGTGGALASLAPFAALLTNPFTIAAAALLIPAAIILGRNKQRRKDEETRTQVLLDAKSKINDLISAVRADRLDGTEAIAQAAQIRGEYLSSVSQLKDKKTRNIALATVREIDYMIENQLKPAADMQGRRKKAYEEFIPTFASGGDVRRVFSGRVPGRYTGRDPYLIRVDGDETVINPAQRARANITDAQLAAAGVPGYSGGAQQVTSVAQVGGPSVVQIDSVEVHVGVTIGPETGAKVLGLALSTPDGKQLVVGTVRAHTINEREDGLAGDVALVLGS